MATGIFMTLGFLVNLQSSYVPLVAHDLLVLSLGLTEPRFCWSEDMTSGILVRCSYKVDIIHVVRDCTCVLASSRRGLDCKAEEEEGSHGVTLSDPTGRGNWVCTSDEQV